MTPWPLLVFAVLVPFLFWAAYHYFHDRHRPEPIGNLMLCVLLGVVAAYLNRGMYFGLGLVDLRYDAWVLAERNLPGLFAYSILGIGLTEELSKLLPFLFVVLRFRAFDEPLDAIVYASFLALGFSIVENLQYLQYAAPAEAFARGFAGPLVHIVFASVWAFPIGAAHLGQNRTLLAAAKGLAVAAVLHGVYDFIAIGFEDGALLFAAALVVAIWIWRLSKLRAMSRASAADYRDPPPRLP